MPVVRFTLLRLGLLVLAGVVLHLVGFRSWLLVLLATLVGLALSFLLLHRQRDEAARWLEARARARRERGPQPGVDELAEDALLEREAEAQQDPVAELE